MKRSTEPHARLLQRLLAVFVVLGASLSAHAEQPVCDLRQGTLTPECRGFLDLKRARVASPPTSTEVTNRAVPSRVQTYSCDLRQTHSQCRRYSLLEGATETLAELKEGCESMGGAFQPVTCPDIGVSGICVDIVRNYHKPDVIYDNVYYQGQPSSPWTQNTMEEVCKNLGGELQLP